MEQKLTLEKQPVEHFAFLLEKSVKLLNGYEFPVDLLFQLYFPVRNLLFLISYNLFNTSEQNLLSDI